ncbi:hypothetical protein [Bifidobacterium sp. SO1]|uniref:hypothetical protein n=1 Tax=Bifidobacterium sp. SO1 TaxID=2809029 RepID=UPI001BDD8C4F|nr:hypothetical protein [Bifidobacterium sp. SO1]MBT1161193.1 hypothetical protein [Bifidobacterium sp. SO1]
MTADTTTGNGMNAAQLAKISDASQTATLDTDGITADTMTTLGLEPLTDEEIISILSDLTGNEQAVQDIWYKGQRVIRTIMQVLVGFIIAAPVVPQIVQALGLDPSGSLYVTLAGMAATVTAIAGALSRVMAIPAVNQWLIKLGMGSVPKSSIGQ